MEVLERKSKIAVSIAILLIVFWTQCKGVEGHRNTTKMFYVCPKDFIRLGGSCFFISDTQETWQTALFSCKDRQSKLAVPARWEDRNLRNFLDQPGIEPAARWIGGIYDYGSRTWKFGAELRKMRYQSFSKMKRMTPEQLQWHCIAMMPELHYRWSPQSCVEKRHFICQSRLQKLRPSRKMDKMNAITAPSLASAESSANDVAQQTRHNPKSYDLRPSELRKRSRSTFKSHLKRPFPGYVWNRRDPDAAYEHNAALLKSGKTGLSPPQVAYQLRRLERTRNKQLARRKRLQRARTNSDWLSNAAPRAHRLSAAHHNTYTVDNHISALHPKSIIEVHDFGDTPPPALSAPSTPADR